MKKTKKKIVVNLKVIKKPNNPLLLAQECKLLLCTHSLEDREREKNSEREEADVFGNKRSKLSTPQIESSKM